LLNSLQIRIRKYAARPVYDSLDEWYDGVLNGFPSVPVKAAISR